MPSMAGRCWKLLCWRGASRFRRFVQQIQHRVDVFETIIQLKNEIFFRIFHRTAHKLETKVGRKKEKNTRNAFQIKP